MKKYLAVDPYPGTDSWGIHHDLTDMVEWVLTALRRELKLQGASIQVPVVIGVPVEYEDERAGSRKVAIERMRVAAAMAGFRRVDFLEEPKAALVYEMATGASTNSDEVCLAVDFGGGTFDAAVSVSGVTPWATDAVEGVAVGGEHFDSKLFTECVAAEMGMEPVLDRFPRLRRRSSMLMFAGDSSFRHTLKIAAQERVRGAALLSEIFERGQIYDLWKEIERAKKQLSDATAVTVDFRKPGVEIRADISREQFEAAIECELEQVRQTMLKAVGRAGVAPADVKMIVRTGGSSSLPAFNRILAETFPNAEVHKRPALTTIVEGLGHYVRINHAAPNASDVNRVPSQAMASSGGRDAVAGKPDPVRTGPGPSQRSAEPAARGLKAMLKRILGRK